MQREAEMAAAEKLLEIKKLEDSIEGGDDIRLAADKNRALGIGNEINSFFISSTSSRCLESY